MENGHEIPVALYERVSTQKQADEGYSLEGMFHELGQRLSQDGRRVVTEVSDRDEKRWTLHRPGVERLRELAASGEVEEIWAWAWDRYGESPWPEVLSIELEEHGVALRALDDGGEGEDAELLRALKSQLAKREQTNRVRRSRMGMFSKARGGEVLGASPYPRYGFEYVRNEKGKAVGYVVRPDTMRVVETILRMLADGESIRGVRRYLEQSGVPAPQGGRTWSRLTIRYIATEDVYMPHSHAQLEAAGVAPDVLARLDPDKPYGVLWFGRSRSRYVSTKKRKYEPNERAEWIAVPVPLEGSGLTREMVERAREAVKDNRAPSAVGDRFWELSGGLLFCSECERRMICYRREGSTGTTHHYYRCRPGSTIDETPCPNRRSHRAGEVEGQVWAAVSGVVNEEDRLREVFDEGIEALGEMGSPERLGALAQTIADLDRRKEGYWDLAASGDMPKEIMRAKVSELEEQRVACSREMEAIKGDAALVAEVGRLRDTLIDGLRRGYWRQHRTPEERRRLYNRMGLRAEIDRDGEILVRFRADGALSQEERCISEPHIH